MEYLKRAAERPAEETSARDRSVAEIIRAVRERGDNAVLDYNTKFDGNTRKLFRVTREEIDAARAQLTAGELSDLEEAHRNIRAFAEKQRECLKSLENVSVIPGAYLGHRVIPLAAVGCYVPGGSYPLFSTALMLITPAKVAGVKRVVACAPTEKGTQQINAKTLAAMDVAGADEIYAVGGVQAIAAMAWGTEQISAVDKIVGPGNQYVAEAKRQCYGQVGIDFVAGPSEVLAICDDSADPEIVAADMLAQSEHDKLAKGIVVTTSRKLGEAVMAAVKRQLEVLPTRAIAEASWNTYGTVILADDLDEAAKIANEIAPEHLEVVTRDTSVADKLVNFGSLFIGEETGEVFGDYASGTNHSLPTLRASRYTGGVWVGTFLKVCTYQHYTREAMMATAPLVSRMAEGEGLMAHKNAADIRMKRLG